MLTGIIGEWALRLLLDVTSVTILFCILSIRSDNDKAWRMGRLAMLGQFVCAATASGALVTLLVTENFHYPYVAEYTGANLPLVYRIAAFWGGNAGSLLLWALVLTLYGAVVAYSQHDDSRRMLPIVSLIVSGVTLFYALIVNLSANPFVRVNQLLPANGLNPLLQNPGMTVHPVNLYLGYIGFTIPFAYAMTGLILKKTDSTWLKVTRRWTLISWLFLSIGIIYGAHWSYEELGWGGYWAWDPVENASLLPWLTSTAFLHTAVVQEKRGMLRGWNVVLITLTFLLTIFGTFLTRSGVLWSIHAFTNSSIGNDYLIFLCLITVGSFGLIIWRRDVLYSKRKFEAVVSKETGFLLNNLLLLGSAFAILWGTVFPIVSESVRGQKLMVSESFYNAVNLPLAVCVLFLMGIGPLLSWRKASLKETLSALVLPSVLALVLGLLFAGILHFTYHRTSVLGTSSLIAALFVVFTVILEFHQSVHTRMRLTNQKWVGAAFGLFARHQRRYGGYIVHLAIAIMATGIAGSGAYHVDSQAQLAPGESADVGGYDITFTGMGVSDNHGDRRLYANLIVERGGKTLGMVRPAAVFYQNGQAPSTDVSIYSRPLRDLYIVMLGTVNRDKAVFDIHVNPLVEFIWFGGYLFILGTFISLWPISRKGEVTESLEAEMVQEAFPSEWMSSIELEIEGEVAREMERIRHTRGKAVEQN